MNHLAPDGAGSAKIIAHTVCVVLRYSYITTEVYEPKGSGEQINI